MRRVVICGLLVMLCFAIVPRSAEAASPGQLSLSLSAGNLSELTAVELELEYSNAPWAVGIHAGYLGAIDKSGLELGILGKYCIDFAKGWRVYLQLNPSFAFIEYFGADITFILEIGPGIEYRYKHFRISFDIGPTLLVPINGVDSHFFLYGKLGVGYVF